jgi:hypothetical protein
VQRFTRAVAPPGDARPGWQLLALLLGALTAEPVPANAADVFAALARECAPFGGLTWDGLGDDGVPAALPR